MSVIHPLLCPSCFICQSSVDQQMLSRMAQKKKAYEQQAAQGIGQVIGQRANSVNKAAEAAREAANDAKEAYFRARRVMALALKASDGAEADVDAIAVLALTMKTRQEEAMGSARYADSLATVGAAMSNKETP